MEKCLELNHEELLVKEIEDLDESSEKDRHAIGCDSDGVSTSSGYTCLASLHTYLGDTNHRVAFACLDGGAILNIPIFCFEVIKSNFVAAIERVLTQGDEPNTFGVVRTQRNHDNRRIKFSTIGTTYQRLEDGSANVPFGEIQIIEEEFPLWTPHDALGVVAPYRSPQGCIPQHMLPSNASLAKLDGDEDKNGDPFWVYHMYDSYCLAQRVSDLMSKKSPSVSQTLIETSGNLLETSKRKKTMNHLSGGNFPIISFDEGYTQLFGDDNLIFQRDGKSMNKLVCFGLWALFLLEKNEAEEEEEEHKGGWLWCLSRKAIQDNIKWYISIT
ncbi:hypothetical protein UlMin_004476 [Ulmus minor]